MQEKKYQVVFSGKISEGKSVEEVKSSLLDKFKVPKDTVEKIFELDRAIVKKDVSYEEAEKHRDLFAECGALCEIEEMSTPVEASQQLQQEEPAEQQSHKTEHPKDKPSYPAAIAPSESKSESASPKPADYDFAIMDVIKEAWEKTKGVKGALWGAGLMVLAVSIGLSIALGIVMRIIGVGPDNIAFSVATQMTVTIALYPFLAGVMMIGVNRAVDRPVCFNMVFGYFEYMVPILIAALLITLLTYLGFMLLVLPGIYLSIAYLLVIPLIIDKNMDAWPAMEKSRKAISRQWFKIFALYLVMGVIYLISMIPFGLGIIWTLPMIVVMNGIVYRIIFGVED